MTKNTDEKTVKQFEKYLTALEESNKLLRRQNKKLKEAALYVPQHRKVNANTLNELVNLVYAGKLAAFDVIKYELGFGLTKSAIAELRQLPRTFWYRIKRFLRRRPF